MTALAVLGLGLVHFAALLALAAPGAAGKVAPASAERRAALRSRSALRLFRALRDPVWLLVAMAYGYCLLRTFVIYGVISMIGLDSVAMGALVGLCASVAAFVLPMLGDWRSMASRAWPLRASLMAETVPAALVGGLLVALQV